MNYYNPSHAPQIISSPWNAAAIYIGGPEEREDAIDFHNSISDQACPLIVSPQPQDPELTFTNDFSSELPGESRANSTTALNHYVDQTELEPMTLILRRETHSDYTQLCDPVTYETIYTIQETDRGFFSSRPDLRIFRAISGDELIGTVHYGLLSSHTVSCITGKSHFGMDHFSSSNFTPEELSRNTVDDSLIWRLTTRKKRPKTRIMEDGKVQLKITEPLFKLELTNPDDPRPLCIVSMFTSRPVGIIEIFARRACINQNGGDWFALDELILSAYANMQRERLRILNRDPPNWKGFIAEPLLCAVMVIVYVLLNVLLVDNCLGYRSSAALGVYDGSC